MLKGATTVVAVTGAIVVAVGSWIWLFSSARSGSSLPLVVESGSRYSFFVAPCHGRLTLPRRCSFFFVGVASAPRRNRLCSSSSLSLMLLLVTVAFATVAPRRRSYCSSLKFSSTFKCNREPLESSSNLIRNK